MLGIIACLVSLLGLIPLADAGTQDSDEKYTEKQLKKAIKDANLGYYELDKVGKKIEKGKGKEAQEHFELALDFFDHALTHFAKAIVGKEHANGVDQLKKGIDELDQANRALDKGAPDKAQQHFDKAQEYFESAESTLK